MSEPEPPPEQLTKGGKWAVGCLVILLLSGLASLCSKDEPQPAATQNQVAKTEPPKAKTKASTNPAPAAEPEDAEAEDDDVEGAALSPRDHFKALCLLNPGEGKALLPGLTIAGFIQKGKNRGRLKMVFASPNEGGGMLRMLVYDPVAQSAKWWSMSFREVGTAPGCEARPAALLTDAAVNGQRLNQGSAIVGGLGVMYYVVQEDLKVSVPE